jgi:hypothetical protein
MSILIALLTILAITVTVGGVTILLVILAERQKERLASPLMFSVCPECGIRFGLTVVGCIDEIKISMAAPADGDSASTTQRSTVISFDCPRCPTGWKYCEGVLVKTTKPDIRRLRPLSFSWLVPLFKETAVYCAAWNLAFQTRRTAGMICRGNRDEIISFVRQKKLSLYLSWFFAVALWSVILPSFPPFYGNESYGRRVEFGFAFMIFGLISGVIAYFRCREKRFAGIAIGINGLPVGLCCFLFVLILEGVMWEQSKDWAYK